MLIMDSWNNDLINDRPTVCKSSHLQSPSDLYREAILALEQAIIHINSSNVEHSFAQFCLEKAFSVTKVSVIITLHFIADICLKDVAIKFLTFLAVIF